MASNFRHLAMAGLRTVPVLFERQGAHLSLTVYRKPTHSCCYLNFEYHHPVTAKCSTLDATAIHSPPMKRFQKIAVTYGADLLAFELNGEVVSGLPGHHSLEHLVLPWARRVVGDDSLEILLMIFFR